MIIVRLLSPGPRLVRTTKAYSGVGADIVMESITLIVSSPSGQRSKIRCLVDEFFRPIQPLEISDLHTLGPKRYS